MDMPDDADLYQLYGMIGNIRSVPVRNICRERVRGVNPWYVTQTMADHAQDAIELADRIEAENGSLDAVARCKEIAHILDTAGDYPADVSNMVSNVYVEQFEPQTDENEPVRCPYEEDASKRACWGCHVPRLVWERLEEAYGHDS